MRELGMCKTPRDREKKRLSCEAEACMPACLRNGEEACLTSVDSLRGRLINTQ